MRMFWALALIAACGLSHANTIINCGATAVCMATSGADDCTMSGGDASYFEKTHPDKPQGTRTYSLYQVTVGIAGKYRLARCYYMDTESSMRPTFSYKAISSHAFMPVYSGPDDEWIDNVDYAYCDAFHYDCTLNAIY